MGLIVHRYIYVDYILTAQSVPLLYPQRSGLLYASCGHISLSTNIQNHNPHEYSPWSMITSTGNSPSLPSIFRNSTPRWDFGSLFNSFVTPAPSDLCISYINLPHQWWVRFICLHQSTRVLFNTTDIEPFECLSYGACHFQVSPVIDVPFHADLSSYHCWALTLVAKMLRTPPPRLLSLVCRTWDCFYSVPALKWGLFYWYTRMRC